MTFGLPQPLNPKILSCKVLMIYTIYYILNQNFIEHLQSIYQEDEQEIQQVKDLDEWILKNAVAHAAVSIHLLEDQLRSSPARIEGVKNQAAKYEINNCFLEPSGYEGITA